MHESKQVVPLYSKYLEFEHAIHLLSSSIQSTHRERLHCLNVL